MDAVVCPGCKKRVADDTSICPHCDYIIDASFLGDVGGAEPTTDENPLPAEAAGSTVIVKEKDLAPLKARPTRSGQGGGTAVGPAPEPEQGDEPPSVAGPHDGTAIVRAPSEAEDEEAPVVSGPHDGTAIVAAPTSAAKTAMHPASKGASKSGPRPKSRPSPERSRAPEPNGDFEDAATGPSHPAGRARPQAVSRYAKYAEQAEDETIDLPPKPAPVKVPGRPTMVGDKLGDSRAVPPSEQLEAFLVHIKGLGFEDKLTVGASLAAALMVFMPWRTTAAEGEDLGILTVAGFFCLLFASMSVAAIVGRLRQGLAQVPRTAFPLVSAGMGIVIVLTTVIFGIASIDRTRVRSPLGNLELSQSTPSFGVWACLMCAGGIIAGGILTFRLVQSQER